MNQASSVVRPQRAASRSATSGRRYDVDWLRVLGVLLLVPLHVGLVFGMQLNLIPVVEASRQDPMAILSGLIYPWHMPLLFLLSGVSSWYALRAHSSKRFLLRRVMRLIPPLIFAVTVLIPPLVYFQFLGQPGWPTSYVAFYPRFYTSIAPEGTLTWLHMWFVAYLMLYTALLLPVFRWLTRPKGQRLIDRLVRIVDQPGGIFILAVPLAAIEIALRGRWPGVQNLIHDVANVVRYLTVVLYGYLLAADERFLRVLQRSVRPAVAVGATTSALLVLQWTALRVPAPAYSPAHSLGLAVWSLNGWAWLVVLLGLGHRYLNRDSRVLRYLSESSLPFYVLHFPITIGVGVLLAGTALPATAAFSASVLGGVAGTYLVYELAVRRFRGMRWLLGMGGR